jgi:type I restriction enzyme R subunit
MTFNEDSRVKIPTVLHLTRLGFQYLSLKTVKWDSETNIFPVQFREAITNINPEVDLEAIPTLLDELKLLLDNDDLGKAFYERLTQQSGLKLIDFQDFSKNSFHVVAELPFKNGEDEFRPDITLLINGMPLVFIEVKPPNNREGILAERKRIATRCQNRKFRKFFNALQLMVFSNNMEYDSEAAEPIEGAFYASSSYTEPSFNYFREEEKHDLSHLLCPESETIENEVLKDNNLSVIKHSAEFSTNKSSDTPTHRICTSLFSKDRLAFLLRYAIAYVQTEEGPQKHIMRYPQMFATKAIEKKLSGDTHKGIIWHTQGSGKTALAYYNIRFLTEHFQKRNVTPKFYFIVDRLDLLNQAAKEFRSRGLVVHTISSKEALAQEIKKTQAIHNPSGAPEITVVNIHKFKDDPKVLQTRDYDVSIQRIYFLDEVHRSYNPKGSFLANLYESDRNAIHIGLTGTPLLGNEYNSRTLFGEYLHKYYYNASIADGYTLRLIREEIESNYKQTLQKALADLRLESGSLDRAKLYSDIRFVTPMLDYILKDFENGRKMHNDNTIGGMVVCDSAEQAKALFQVFQKQETTLQSALILHDVDSKEDRKESVEDFKAGKIDLLFVYNMLLTGFDAPRLKKLYLGRIVHNHNLLQTLTRVNRPYRNFRYGYVVDFADIQKEFEEVNQAYLNELQEEVGDEFEHYSRLFKSPDEINQDIEQIKDALFRFNIENAEIFSQQMSQIQNKAEVLAVKKALANARSLYNLIRLQGSYPLLEQLDFQKLNRLYLEASRRLDLLNHKENLESDKDNTNLLHLALEDIIFSFIKVGESELAIADQLRNTLEKARETLLKNFDQQDPEFITLREELERLFKKKKLNEITQEEMNSNVEVLNSLAEKGREMNRKNDLLKQKYHGDAKYARIHKRLIEQCALPERQLFSTLSSLKAQIDDKILQNAQLISNEPYFERMVMPLTIAEFQAKGHTPLNLNLMKTVSRQILAEHINEYNSGNRLGKRI